MEIQFDLTTKEAIGRQLTALWNDGFANELLAELLPRVQKLSEEHYLEIANSGIAGLIDPRIGIESGRMFRDLTTPIIQEQSIILDTSLDYALEQEARLAKSGRSFLFDEAQLFGILQDVLSRF